MAAPTSLARAACVAGSLVHVMSNEAINSVIGIKCSRNAKAVLVCLAWHKNQVTGQCNPSSERICTFTCMSRASVTRAMAELRSSGRIKSWKHDITKSCNYSIIPLAQPEPTQAEPTQAEPYIGSPETHGVLNLSLPMAQPEPIKRMKEKERECERESARAKETDYMPDEATLKLLRELF